MQTVKAEENSQIIRNRILSYSNPDHFQVACHKIPDYALLDQKKSNLDLNVIKQHLANQGKLTVEQVKKILKDAEKILQLESNLIEIDSKCYIFGDVHGQFYDLLALLERFDPNKDTLLFLGDYVDRGQFSVETYLYLVLLKTHFPKNVFLLRGNHESEKMTTYFTFKAECVKKYNEETYKEFLRSFKMLPMAAVVQKKAFCAHAGISPNLLKLSDLNQLNRIKEIEYSGVLCDIVWSDPHEFYDLGLGSSWEYNDKRRCSYKYNFENVKKFLERTELSMVIRAHEVQENGYCLMKEYKGVPSVITIFSAPAYCDSYQNKGAYIEFDQGVNSIVQFEAVPHPFVLNGFLDGFNWSLPFVSSKMAEFAISLFNELDSAILEEPENLIENMEILRLEREAIDEFEKDEGVDCCVLSTIEDDFEAFDISKEKDKENEIKKTKSEESGISISLSPSIQPEEIQNLILKEAEKNKQSQEKPKKKGFTRYLCGLCK